jgi:hypothetical protein
MPRRTGRKIRARTTSTLTLPVEWSLVHWQGLRIIGSGCETLEQFETAWSLHGEAVFEHYVRQIPGSRPFAMYVLGLVPMPAEVEAPRLRDAAVRIGDKVFHERHVYDDELEHLVDAGIVTGEEEALARQRESPVSHMQAYKWLSPTSR